MARKALIIIAQEGYQDIELAGTRDGLLAAGFNVVLASRETGPCKGKLGGAEQASVALRDVKVADYECVALIGGPGSTMFLQDGEAHRIAREVVAAKKPLGAICFAPSILAAAGVLTGKRATVWNGDDEQGHFLTKHGANYTGEAITHDGLIVTASGPAAAQEFGSMLASL